VTTYNRQRTLIVPRHSTEALAIQQNFKLLKGEVWRETDSTGYPTGRSKTGVDGQVVNNVIVGTAFVDLPFDPTGPGGTSAPTNLTVIDRTATSLKIASSTGGDAEVPLASLTLAGLESAADKAKLDSIIVDSARIIRIPIRNNSGVTIPKGAPCYQTGSSGTAITVALADASSEATASQTLGLAEAEIPNNSNGILIERGLLDGLNTSALTEGQIVWLSETTGALATTRPTQPAHGVVCGYCIKQGAGTSGILYVRVSNGQELYELHDVLITGAPDSQAQVLRRFADGLWRNSVLGPGDVGAATAAQGALATTAVQPGEIGSSGLTMTAGILGRESGSGAAQVFTLGSGLAIVGGALTVTAGPGGGYPSLSMPPGFSVSGSGTALLGVTFAAGYSLPTTAKQTEWDAAYSERLRWDGSSTGLNATTARTSLGLGSAAQSAATDFAATTAPAAVVAAHEAATDPHPQYLTTAEGNAAYATAAQGNLAATAVQPAALAGYVQTNDSRLSDSREWSAATVAQADAEAGTSTIRVAYNPLRVFQSIAAWWAASSAKTKLDSIASGATANQTDAYLLSRANHTGTQAAGTITGLGTLALQSGTFSGTSSGTNTGDQDLSGLVVKANNLSDLANTATARSNLGAAAAADAVTAVTHGSNASTARPSGVTAVYWIGTVEPVNAVNGDLWIGGI